MDLFSLQEAEAREGFEPGADTSAMPLAARMRPRTWMKWPGRSICWLRVSC